MAGGVLGAIIAGGQARRLGGVDKCLAPVAGVPILDRLLEILRPQLASLLLVANGDAQRFAAHAVAVTADDPDLPEGPMAGIVTALRRAAAMGYADVCVVPGDTPVLPADLVAQLAAGRAADGVPISRAVHRGNGYPVISLWSSGCAPQAEALVRSGSHAIWRVQAALGCVEVRFDAAPVAAFMDVDSSSDLAVIEGLLAEPPGL